MNAPIVVFVYNRADHARGLLRSLAQCRMAKESDLYIFSDGAKNEAGAQKVAEVREYINSREVAEAFQTVTVTEAPQNRGVDKSVIAGVDTVICRYGKVIVVEDDNTVSKDFLEFMNGALDYYENNPGIWAIGGYTLPIRIPEDYTCDVFRMGRGSSYAWATWLDRWEKVDWTMPDYPAFRKDRKQRKAFDRFGNDRSAMLEGQYCTGEYTWDISFSFHAFKYEKGFVLPTKSRVKNNGNDGSGTHVSGKDTRFDTVMQPDHPPVKFEDVSIDERLRREVVRIFNRSFSVRCKQRIKKLLTAVGVKVK